ncbi:MAG: hypothetical protein U9N14_04315 [Pseudomonadota bacterium]|nr:hypothetical protein [Pseudomonadota bacterium]
MSVDYMKKLEKREIHLKKRLRKLTLQREQTQNTEHRRNLSAKIIETIDSIQKSTPIYQVRSDNGDIFSQSFTPFHKWLGEQPQNEQLKLLQTYFYAHPEMSELLLIIEGKVTHIESKFRDNVIGYNLD